MLILDENFRWHLEAFALNSSYTYIQVHLKKIEYHGKGLYVL